jgi:hypothetical protein
VSALLFDKSVEALLIVIQNDALLETGLPVPYIDRIHNVAKKSNQDDISWQNQMMSLLKAHSKQNLN